MDTLLSALRIEYPNIRFMAGKTCCWSAQTQTITYDPIDTDETVWGILHELGHALLGHTTYQTDIELLQKEMLAWEEARILAEQHNIRLNEDHIQDCLDSYRDWINRRSTCPMCGTKSLSTAHNEYQCFNCQTTWHVSPARHHRPYRRQIQKLP